MKKLQKWKGLAFVLPSLVGVIIFYIFPFMSSLSYCFTSGVGVKRFVGLDNFKSLLQNEAYQLALKNTARIMGIGIVLLCALAIMGALMIEEHLHKYRSFQCWLLMPMAIPTASMVLIWNDLLAQEGILNGILDKKVDWLESEWAPYIIIGMIIWKNIGYDVLLIISSLLVIPKEYEEAASLEGANRREIAWYIKIPQLTPMFFFMLIISLFNVFKIFREVYLLEGDYPNEKLYLLQHFMNNNFANLNYQMLTTAAFMLYMVIWTIIFILSRWQQRYIESNS